MFTAYNVRTKEKNVEILDAVLSITSKGAVMVQGVSAGGQKLTTLVNKEKAIRGLREGWGKPGWTDDVEQAIADLETKKS